MKKKQSIRRLPGLRPRAAPGFASSWNESVESLLVVANADNITAEEISATVDEGGDTYRQVFNPLSHESVSPRTSTDVAPHM